LESLHDTGIPAVEVVVVPGAELDFAADLDCPSAVAIKLELMQSIRALGQPLRAEQKQRLDERGFGLFL
jgi:hypothetical protein